MKKLSALKSLQSVTALFCGAVLAFSCSCAGAQSTTSAGANARCLPVVPMRVLALEHGRAWELVATLAPDGFVYHRGSKGNAPIGRIWSDSVSGDRGGATLSCGSDWFLYDASGKRTDSHFTDRGDLEMLSERSVIHVDDSGQIVVVHDGQVDPRMAARIEGDIRGARRTAAMLAMLAMFGGDWSF